MERSCRVCFRWLRSLYLFFFDNAGDPYLDTTIPTIVSSTAISSTELDVMFSEPIDQITAETASNYSVDGGIGVPSTSILDY